VELVSAAEPFRGQDPANVLFRQVIGAFAQFEKARIAERMSGGRRQKARIGGYAGGGAAIGYKASRGSKALQVDEEKAGTVRRVFELARRNPGWTLQHLADVLNGEGHTTAQGKAFGKMQVQRILKREGLYGGTYCYAGVSAAGKHEALL
jgi:DNA invertase Pin-like site-specific DNA recombinase